VIVKEEDYLQHYGTPRHSGRYPWGSGGEDSTRNRSLLDAIKKLEKEGMSQPDIAKGLGFKSTTELRAVRTIAIAEERQEKIRTAMRLKAKGMSNPAIAKQMGLPGESSVRSLLDPSVRERASILETTANMLKEQVDEKGYIDVGRAVEHHIGVSRDKLNVAIAMLEQQGYTKFNFPLPQVTAGHNTTTKVLGKPGAPFPKRDQLRFITDHSEDGGRTYFKIQPPIQVDSKRIHEIGRASCRERV